MQHKSGIIPAGTKVSGKVVRIQSGRRLARPGYVLVDFEQVSWPGADSQAETLDLKPLKLGNAQSHGGRSLLGRHLIMFAASNAVTIPITLVGGLPHWTLFIIGNAIDGVTGAIQEVRIQDPEDHRSALKKAATGAFRGATGIPTLVHLMKRSPNIEMMAETPTPVQLPKALWKSLLSEAEPESVLRVDALIPAP